MSDTTKRSLQCYPKWKTFKMFKAYCSINDYKEAHGLEQMIKFFFSQYSEQDKEKLVKAYNEEFGEN